MSFRYILCPIASRTFFVHLLTMSEPLKLQFKLMVPSGLKDQLEQAAHENRRSLSGEMIARLEASFTPTKPTLLLDDLAATFTSNLAKEPGVKEADLKALMEEYALHRDAEWKNIKSFMEVAATIIQRATSKESPDGQLDFVTEERKQHT